MAASLAADRRNGMLGLHVAVKKARTHREHRCSFPQAVNAELSGKDQLW